MGKPSRHPGSHRHFWGRVGPGREPLGQPTGTRGFLLGAGKWVRGPPKGMPGPQCPPGQSHAVGVSAPSHPCRRRGGNVRAVGVAAGNELGIPRTMLWIQPPGPTPDVCPPAPAAAPTSPRFSPAQESPSLPRWQWQQLRKRKRRPRHPPTAAWGVFWVWRKAEGSTGRAMPRSTQGMVVDRERGTPTPPRAPRSRLGDGESGSVSPEA